METEAHPGAGLRRADDAVGHHDALLHTGVDELVVAAVRHLREGAERGEALLIACTGERAELLLRAVDDPGAVAVIGNGDTYPSPFAAMQSYVDTTRRALAAGATGLRVVGELPLTSLDHPHTWPGWSRYEAVVNHVLTALPFHALCCYDVRRADPSLLWMALQTHERTWEAGVRRANPHYLTPAECLRRWSDPPVLPVEHGSPLLEVARIDDAARAREARTRVGDLLAAHDTALLEHAAALPPEDPSHVAASEYLLGLDEVLANALTHGTGPATLRLWADHDRVVTTVTDAGDGFHDPFAGYTPGSARSADGRSERPALGLWLARQMCDELSFRHDAEGFTARLRADLDVRFA